MTTDEMDERLKRFARAITDDAIFMCARMAWSRTQNIDYVEDMLALMSVPSTVSQVRDETYSRLQVPA